MSRTLILLGLSGLSSFLRNPPVLELLSRSRWIVFASCLRLGHTIGRASSQRAERGFHAFGGEHGQDSVEQRRLADAGPASAHRDLVQRPENR